MLLVELCCLLILNGLMPLNLSFYVCYFNASSFLYSSVYVECHLILNQNALTAKLFVESYIPRIYGLITKFEMKGNPLLLILFMNLRDL
jgi:hypothetical protein